MESRPLHDDTRRAIFGAQGPLHNALCMLEKALARLPMIPADDVPQRLLWREQIERAVMAADCADKGMVAALASKDTPTGD